VPGIDITSPFNLSSVYEESVGIGYGIGKVFYSKVIIGMFGYV
jgi:hypothetical protein